MTRIHKPLIDTIVAVLDADPRVRAAWLEGSIARGEDDDCSDIDLWVAVRDKDFEAFILERELFAAKIGPVLSVLYPKTPDQGVELDSFRIMLEDQPACMTIDVDVQKESRKFRFTKGSSAEECKVLFDKGKVISYRPFNPEEVEEYGRELFDDVSVRFWHGIPKVHTYIEREDMLEAAHAYAERLEELVMVYRIMYTPEKADWGYKDIEYDLPEEAVDAVYALFPTPQPKSLRTLTHRLAKLFAKESERLGKRLRREVPYPLIKKVLREL